VIAGSKQEVRRLGELTGDQEIRRPTEDQEIKRGIGFPRPKYLLIS
jgi:hypothetical protein